MEEHLKWCPHCAELFRNAAALGRRLAQAASLEPRALNEQLAVTESLLERERGVRAYLRSRSTRARWALSLALPAVLLARELVRKRVPWRELGSSRVLAGLVLVGLLGVVLRGALRPLPIGRRAARLRTVLAMVAWCLPFVLWLAPEAHAGGEDLSGHFALRSLTCFAYGSALAAPSFALLGALDRGMHVPFRVWALGAGVVGIVGNLILAVHCASTNAAHVLVGHFSIGLAWFMAVCVAAGWRRAA